MEQPPIVPVDAHHWHRWIELLLSKIRRAALRRRLQTPVNRGDALYDVDRALAEWQQGIANRLPGSRLQFMQDKVPGIYAELCRLYLTVFERSVMHPSIDNFKTSVAEVLIVTAQNLLDRVDNHPEVFPFHADQAAIRHLSFPSRTPKDGALSETWFAYQLDVVSGSWLLGHAARDNAVSDIRDRLATWRSGMAQVFTKAYLRTLLPHATKSLDLFLDLSLPDQTKQVVVRAGVHAAAEFILLIEPATLAQELAHTPAYSEGLPRTDTLPHHAREEFRALQRERQLPDWAPTDFYGFRPDPPVEVVLAPVMRAREEARLLQPIADHLAHLASQAPHGASPHSAQSLGSEPRIANRIARVVYGIEPRTWARERSAPARRFSRS